MLITKDEKGHCGQKLIKIQCVEYEKSEENFIRSLSLLYAGGVISKVKYQQTTSSMVMKNTGRHTKKGFMSKERITYGWGVSQFLNHFHTVSPWANRDFGTNSKDKG